jgi:class 3 adenylate cyclase
MQRFIEERAEARRREGVPYFRMRAGINSGPVVGGIVGVKKFQYDLWGDTVNTASRMETHGDVGRVNVSQSTYALVQDQPGFTFEPRGAIEVKGKGMLRMYFVAEASGGGL